MERERLVEDAEPQRPYFCKSALIFRGEAVRHDLIDRRDTTPTGIEARSCYPADADLAQPYRAVGSRPLYHDTPVHLTLPVYADQARA